LFLIQLLPTRPHIVLSLLITCHVQLQLNTETNHRNVSVVSLSLIVNYRNFSVVSLSLIVNYISVVSLSLIVNYRTVSVVSLSLIVNCTVCYVTNG